MSAHGSKKALFAALGANLVIAVAKFSGAAITGSSAMLSEGVHSVVDTGNQLVLLYGMKDAAKPADRDHPLGYGLRIYFWGFVVAVSVFAMGSLVAIYEGIEKIREPHPIENAWVNAVILIASMMLEGWSLSIAIRDVRAHAQKNGMGLMQAIRTNRDPGTFAVIYEETAALAGLGTALIGICLALVLDMPVLDGWTSVAIGVILAMTSITLAAQCRRLMTGSAADPEIEGWVRDILGRVKCVDGINEVRTLQLGPNDVVVLVSVDFDDDTPAGSIEKIVSDVGAGVTNRFPEVRRVYIEPQSLEQHEEDLQEIGESPDALDGIQTPA